MPSGYLRTCALFVSDGGLKKDAQRRWGRSRRSSRVSLSALRNSPPGRPNWARRQVSSLLAARAAQRLRQFGRRDQWLERAKEGDGEWRLARLMTAAELLLEERRFLEARAVLREVNAGRPRHVAALLLSLRAEQGMANWDEVLRVANLLEKRD